MKLNDLDLNKVATFCQIVDSGGYPRASEVLNVTPSALSQTVSGLEGALGFLLFDRIGKRMVPTAKALTLHREFRRYESGFLKTLEELTTEPLEVAGVLRIGAYLEFAKAQLSGLIQKFIREFPEAQLKLAFDTPTRLHTQVQQGQLDLCFSIFPAPDKSVSSFKVYEEELVLISSRHFLKDTPTYEQVLATPMIEYYVNHQPIRRWLQLHYQKRPRKIPVRVYASTSEMVVSLVREGAGIGVVPIYAVNPQDRALRIVRPSARRLTDHIWLLEKVATSKSVLHRTFKEKLLAHLAVGKANED